MPQVEETDADRNVLGLIRRQNTVLFAVWFNSGQETVVYEAKTNTKRELIGVDVYWSKRNNHAERVEIGDMARRLFFGVQTTSYIKPDGKPKRGWYNMKVNCMAYQRRGRERSITLKVKKRGAVHAYINIDGRECILHRISLDMTQIPPALNKMVVHAKFGATVYSDEIPIDMGKFNMSSLMGLF